MRSLFFAPFASLSQESGVMFLLANYVSQVCEERLHLVCNGTFSLCDRDADSSWKRNFSSCAGCSCDQRKLSDWSSLEQVPLSSQLRSSQIELTKRWIMSLKDDQLCSAEYFGQNIFDLCNGSFEKRFGSLIPDRNHKQHFDYLRRLLLSTSRMLMAANETIKSLKPDIVCIAGGEDYLSSTMYQVAKKRSVPVAKFHWDPGSRYIKILHPDGESVMPCELLFDSLTSMRSDPGTWPDELIGILDEILLFLGISESQLALPIASSSA